jgi:protein TonB
MASANDTFLSDLHLYKEVRPTFPGGNEELKEFIEENLRWPVGETGFTGTVLTSFIVEEDGHLTNIQIEQSECQLCNVESLRLIDSMPDWQPGSIAGKPVRMLLYLPLRFEINE